MMGELKVGDQIKDNDPRMQNRYLRITHLATNQHGKPTYVWGIRVNALGREVAGLTSRISAARIYTDDKPRRSGFSLVRGA